MIQVFRVFILQVLNHNALFILCFAEMFLLSRKFTIRTARADLAQKK